MSEELKPCPFCGSHDVQIVQFSLMYSPENELVDVRPGLQIECSKCHLACLNYMLDKNENLELERDELIRAWNKRSLTPAQEHAEELYIGLSTMLDVTGDMFNAMFPLFDNLESNLNDEPKRWQKLVKEIEEQEMQS